MWSKTRRIIICRIIIGCILLCLFLTYMCYGIDNLQVKQSGKYIYALWNGDYSKYRIILFGDKTRTYDTNTNAIVVSPGELGKEYRIIVIGKTKSGIPKGILLKKVKTRRLKQEIIVDKNKIEGISEKINRLNVTANGMVFYRSDNPSVVKINQEGKILFGKDGDAKIYVFAFGTPQYNPSKKIVDVSVYPNKLKTPEMTIKEKTHDEATIAWSSVQYAEKYVLEKFSPTENKYVTLGETVSTSAIVHRIPAKYRVYAKAVIDGKKVKSIVSNEIEVKSAAEEAKTYNEHHTIGEINMKTCELVTEISGVDGANVPQSMSHIGEDYVVTYVNMSGTKGALKAYSKDGKFLGVQKIKGAGHANGSTYNPNTGKVYTVKTHQFIYSSECSAYNPGNGKREVVKLPKNASGIAYDKNTDSYYISKGNELYVLDSEFKLKKSLRKTIRYNHSQDIACSNGVFLVCTWVSGNESYIDLYRESDNGYLGSYNVPIGEIESCFIDDGYLVILMNNSKNNGDCIIRTKDKVKLP